MSRLDACTLPVGFRLFVPQEQQTLQQWQDKERTALKAGFQQVTELEQQRLQLAKQVSLGVQRKGLPEDMTPC